jgi:hypothetical protein
MANYEKFPSIESFRSAITEVKQKMSYDGKDENGEPKYKIVHTFPIGRFLGTVKLHGTHADIVLDPLNDPDRLSAKNESEQNYGTSTWKGFYSKDDYHFQSRNCVITPESDNMKFATIFSLIPDVVLKLFEATIDILGGDFDPTSPLMISGEWCGGNIQKGVALSQLSKRYVIYAIKHKGKFLDIRKFRTIKSPDNLIFNIMDFETWEINIDFNSLSVVQNELCKLTDYVEKECPVGKFFGVSGVGEGIVWTCMGFVNSINDTECYSTDYTSEHYITFKVKGKEHSTTRVKTLVEIDLELQKNIQLLVEMVMTESRLKQGLDYLTEQHIPHEIKNIGFFTKWISSDVAKEESERIDQSLNSNETKKNKFNSTVSKKASEWFKKYLSDLTSNTTSNETSNNASNETSNNASNETSNNASNNTSNNASNNALNDTSNNPSNDTSNDTSNNASNDTSNNASNDTSNNALGETSNAASEFILNNASEITLNETSEALNDEV